MTRIRKAWRVEPKWSGVSEIIHAPTASKARYQAFLDWREPYPDIEIMGIQAVRRAAEADIEMPPPHRLVAELSPVERHFIEHAFGSAGKQPGYRDHYCAGIAEPPLLRLTFELGLFDGPFGHENEYGESIGWSGVFFYLTDLGKSVARSMLSIYPR